jgi:hypothetical protein
MMSSFMYACIEFGQISATWQPRERHVASTSAPRGIHVAATSVPRGSQLISTSDVASQSMTITFVTDFGLWAGFIGIYTNLWRSKSVMDYDNPWQNR